MTMNGVFKKWVTTLKRITAGPGYDHAYEDRLFEFGIRWEGDEIAQDVLVLDTNSFADAPERIVEGGQAYTLTFTEEHLQDVIAVNDAQPEGLRPSNEIALRYYLEFDAFLTTDAPRSRAVLGARGRSPADFIEKWLPETTDTAAPPT